MLPRLVPGLAAWPLLAAAAAAGPPATSRDASAPGPEVASRWLAASLQEPLLNHFDPVSPRSEAARMLAAVRKGEQLGPGVGWYDPARRRHDWSWLAARFDADRDGRVTRTEFTAPAELFTRLDRDRDGAVAAEDFDWSERSAWVRQDAQALRFFRAIDGDGDGRINEGEMQTYFRKRAGEKGHLTPNDVRDALAGPQRKGKRVSRETWLDCLMAGDLGSPFEGPQVGQEAPDFTLVTHDGKTRIALSDYRGKRPVVLIFGSFTWGPFRAQFGSLEDLSRRYGDRAAFLAVYVREAHPADGAFSANNQSAGIVVRQPRSLGERAEVAHACSTKLRITMPLLVDTIDDRVGHAYSGMPDRLYVIDRGGKVAYQGGRGPFGFKPGELEQSLIGALIEDGNPVGTTTAPPRK